MKSLIRKLTNFMGYDVIRYPRDYDILKNYSIAFQRTRLMNKKGVKCIFDVGANVGQYAFEIRKFGFTGNIISFEPTMEAFDTLKKNTQNDENWKAVNMAIGDFDGEIVINVSKNSVSSSILNILPTHIESAEDSVYVKEEVISIGKIDTIIGEYITNNEVFLKIDTQGFEMNVLRGSMESLSKIQGFQMELSLSPLYENETLFNDMVKFLESLGYKLYSIEPGFKNPKTDQLLQVDGIFFKE